MPTIQYTDELTVTQCWCGIHLAIPSNLYRVAHQDGTNVYCPLGHQFAWTNTTQKQLERAEARLQATRDLLAREERSHAATRGHLTRSKKRAAAAVCPCCNRSFVQLRRHLATKHPEYRP